MKKDYLNDKVQNAFIKFLNAKFKNNEIDFKNLVDKHKAVDALANLLKNKEFFKELMQNNSLTREDLKYLLNRIRNDYEAYCLNGDIALSASERLKLRFRMEMFWQMSK